MRLTIGARAVPRGTLPGAVAGAPGRMLGCPGGAAAWLGRDRVLAWSAVLLAEEALAFALFLLWAAGALGATRPPFVSDFVSFYGAGSLATGGAPALAYDQGALAAAEHAIAGPDRALNYFFYPPPFLLLCAALARLPYLAAYAAFQAATLALYLLALRSVLGDARRPGWWLPALAFPALWWSAALGQNAALTAALFGAGTLLIDRRPLAGGLLLGLLAIKPHLGLLVPVALAAGRNWRGVAGAALSAGGLALASLLAFGWPTWSAYLAAFAASDAVYATGRIAFAGFVTPFGAARLLGLPPDVAGAVQAAATLAAAAFVARVWRRGAALPVRAAALIAATLLSVPVLLVYDLLPLAIAAAWLVRPARGAAFLAPEWLASERLALAVPWAVALLSLAAGLALRLPLGPLAPLAVLAVCAARLRAPAGAGAARRLASIALGAGLVAAPAAVPAAAWAAWPDPAVLQCVAFARERTHIDLAGDAWRWWYAAEGRYPRGQSPAIGSVLSFRPSARIPLGHVAVVTRILGPRLIEVDQANWAGPGTISRSVEVADASPGNDWTLVRVRLAGGGFGQDYPANGFIYAAPRQTGPQIVDVAAALRGLSGGGAAPRAQVVDVAAALRARAGQAPASRIAATAAP